MSNHYHVVLHVDKARAEAWSREEVVERWLQLCKGSVLVDQWLKAPDELDKASQAVVYEILVLNCYSMEHGSSLSVNLDDILNWLA